MRLLPNHVAHPSRTRRVAIQAGAVGLLGLGMNHVAGLHCMGNGPDGEVSRRPRSVIYIFLSGGLAQHDSFDPKPEAPDTIRGEFKPIATQTAGIQICEHLPMLAACSGKWALVRSLTHPYNEHSIGHHVMLTGRTPKPAGFNANRPTVHDFPSIASVANRVVPPRNNLPPAAVLPEKLIHVTGRTIPDYYRYEAPRLELAEGVLRNQFDARRSLLASLESQRRMLDVAASTREFDRHRQTAVSMLLEGRVHRALDVHSADDRSQDRYGRNSFGWSLLMARQLVEAGVSLVQVNLGNNESWDTHEAAFRVLKDFLLPPTDRAVSALIEDLSERGLLDDVLIVMAGEFGRTPKVFTFPGAETKLPGAIIGGRCKRCSLRVGACVAARSSVSPTRSAASRSPPRRRPRTSPPRSMKQSGCRRPLSGRIASTVRIRCTTAIQSPV